VSSPRNVVLVTVDSLRADHCSYWGYDRETTPTLDRMAGDGVVFEQAIAPGPSTYESMPAVFTGRHMTSFRPDVRSRQVEGGSDEDELDARTRTIGMNMAGQTLVEWFDRQGYATAAFTTNPYTGAHTEFARGFDRYEDFMDDGEGFLMGRAAHLPVLSELKHVVTLVRGNRASKRWAEYYDRIADWIASATEPYFLWVFLLDPHTPYLVDERFRSGIGSTSMYYHNWRLWIEKKWRETPDSSSLNRERLVDLYDGAVRAVDAFLERLLEDAAASDPAVVVHADHGEAFGEHGTFGHQAALYEENLRVPLVAYNVGGSDTRTAPVSLVELPALLQSTAMGDAGSLPPNRSGPILSKTYDAERISLRGPDWKYVCRTDPADCRIVGERAYDLSSDPGERSPAADIGDDVLADCRRTVRRRLRHEQEHNAIVSGVTDEWGTAWA